MSGTEEPYIIGPQPDLGFPHDHGEIAWNHFLAEHIDKQSTESFVRSFYPPLNILDNVLAELYLERWIKNAQGSALDGLGSIVGIGRDIPAMIYLAFFGFVSQPAGRAFGEARMRKNGEAYSQSSYLPDEEYRVAITAKIFLNNGHGTSEEIIQAMEQVLGLEETGKVHIDDIGNANANLYIPELITQADPRFYLIDQLVPRAGGVKLWIIYTDSTYIFGFQGTGDYYGFFDVALGEQDPPAGILSRRPISQP